MEKLKEYFLCTRPHSFPAALAPVLIGSSFSLLYIKEFNTINFILFLFACLFIQAATNLFNEYYDYKRGLDKVDSQGISASILKNKLTENEVLFGAVILYVLAFFIGIILALSSSLYLLVVGIICMIFGYLYTGGKYPIAYSPFGELVAGFFMGTVIIILAFYLQVKFINFDVVIISIPMFILIGDILLANNIRDLDNDKLSGRNTFAILVGKSSALNAMKISFIIVYLLNFIFIFTNYGSIYNLLVFLTLPVAIKIIRGLKNNQTKESMAPFMVLTAKITIFIGLLTSLSYILKYLL